MFLQHPNDFQVSWHDLNYLIEEKKPTWTGQIKQKTSQTFKFATEKLNFSSRRGSYDLEQDIKADPRHDAIQILHSLNGSFRSGQLTAVIGPSGAGKTSLLNFITRRREKGYDGSLLVSGRKQENITVNAIAQTDHLAEYLTVRENLTFASKLKNPTLDGLDHEKNVARVSHLLGLDECLDTRTQKISGGQQKRLSIAQELLSKPDVLILDEPTSGLDSSTCLHTLGVLKDVVRSTKEPVAIMLTIHQPQSEVFELFDKVYVMATGGVVIYDGPPSECVEFVEKYSGLKMPADDYNPASFLIDIASGEFGPAPIEALRHQVDKQFRREHPNHQVKSKDGLQKQPSKPELQVDSRLVKGSSTDQGHFCYKTSLLTKRCWMSLMRDRNLLISRIVVHVMLPFFMRIILGPEPGQANACPHSFSEFNLQKVMTSDEYTSKDRQEELLLTHNNVGLLYQTVYASIAIDMMTTTVTFGLDLKSSLREYYNGWYSINSYLIARLLGNLFFDITLPMTTIVLLFWVSEQNTTNGQLADVYRVAIWSVAFVTATLMGQYSGLIFGSIYQKHLVTGLFVSLCCTLPPCLLSGFVTRTKNMSAFVRALSWTSIYRHCLDIMFIARYGYNVCACDEQTLVRSRNVTMTGVSEDLRSFTKYMLNAQSEQVAADANSTQEEDEDVFQLIAKQLNLYNTYGIELNSCKDVVPYQLSDFSLTEADLLGSYLALVTLLVATILALFLTVRYTMAHKVSL